MKTGVRQRKGSLRYTRAANTSKETALVRPAYLAALVTAMFSLCACDHAVRAHTDTRYLVEGNRESALYPKEVAQRDEDVLITLKPGTPPPEMLLVEADGRETRFPFVTEGDTLIVPGKFGHLRLRHDGDSPVDVVEKTATN